MTKKETEKKTGKKEPHHIGHRKRLKDRFMRSNAEAMEEYELLELVLFQAIPRKDVKPMAKAMIEACGDLSAVFSSSPARLEHIPGMTKNVLAQLKLVEAIAARIGLSRVMHKPVISSWDGLINYCRTTMAEKDIESFRVLFLDRKNSLIADELVSTGTVDHTPVYPREVMKRAIALSASAIILVHNHPSGDPTPSKADIEMTHQIRDIGESLGIVLHDHLIIARSNEASFKALNLL